MAKAPFVIIERTVRSGKRVFMARYFGKDGAIIRSVSFPEAKNRTAAVRLAETKLQSGIIANVDNLDVLTYVRNFWSQDSEYVRGRAVRGDQLSIRYLKTVYTV
jgi:hypothetical protein